MKYCKSLECLRENIENIIFQMFCRASGTVEVSCFCSSVKVEKPVRSF